jgi:hypothetical protein
VTVPLGGPELSAFVSLTIQFMLITQFVNIQCLRVVLSRHRPSEINQLQQRTQSARSRNARSVGLEDYYSRHDKRAARDERDYRCCSRERRTFTAPPRGTRDVASQPPVSAPTVANTEPQQIFVDPVQPPATPVDLTVIERTQWRAEYDRIFAAWNQQSDAAAVVGPVV